MVESVRLHLDPSSMQLWVTYQLRFQPHDRGAWFRDLVEVRGAGEERVLVRFSSKAWQFNLTEVEGVELWAVSRRTPPVRVRRSDLDERPDESEVEAVVVRTPEAVLLYAHEVVVPHAHRIYAHVRVDPIVPERREGRSDLHVGQFGGLR
ncbi:MAG: hypothetical protein GY937_08615 [bacterium]|nr:hypothetical protein [bacterium]